MDTFVQRFAGKIKGVITGFDRIVFKGCLRPLMFADGAMAFLRSRGVLNKNYKAWVMEQSETLATQADRYAHSICGRGVVPIPSCHERKEKIAHDRQRELGVEHGLIGVWSCVESCSTFRAAYDAQAGFPQLRPIYSRCKHLYFYYDHADYGFMSVRLQTWFPYGIQIAINGREWLRRALAKQKIPFVLHDNKFLHIADYPRAQQLLDTQINARWLPLLGGFLPQTFPAMNKTLGPHLNYYWTLWQSEWATDYIFAAPDDLKPLLDALLRHALITGTGDRVLRYFGRPVNAAGQPHPLANPEVLTRANAWHDGVRIRHWVDQNSVKLYNEHNVLRVEMTMNNPAMFRVFRRPEGRRNSIRKKRMPLRKGIADITIRAQVANDVNRRFMGQMATLKDDRPMRDVLTDISQPSLQNGRRIRALDLTGKDRELLLALADPQYAVAGFTNKQLRRKLCASPWAKGGTDQQLSARVSRHLRLLRDHGLIRKLPCQRKYLLTAQGQLLTTALNAILAASTQQLLDIAA
ncbi:MAG: hypothetical protein EPN89_14170 [Methylovulum sp.]|nr:MAG: hypothetical protein EPN89_14170 [Methylovulum sp.]